MLKSALMPKGLTEFYIKHFLEIQWIRKTHQENGTTNHMAGIEWLNHDLDH